jgi:hypothetical protein
MARETPASEFQRIYLKWPSNADAAKQPVDADGDETF